MSYLLLAALVLGADKAEPSPEPDSPPPKADVRGEVKSIPPPPVKSRLYLGRLLVEVKKEKDTTHDKAIVLVLNAAKVYRWKAGKKVEAKYEDIVVGCKIQAVFDGPAGGKGAVVSGRATEVLILSTPKKE